jgi:hypothetical protein
MPKTLGAEPTHRSRRIVVIPRPYVLPDPAGEKYEQYCRQSLMQHKPFRQMDDLLSQHGNYIDAYAAGHSCSLARSLPVSRMICIVSSNYCKAMKMTLRRQRLDILITTKVLLLFVF